MTEPVIVNNETKELVPDLELFKTWVSLVLEFHKKQSQVSIQLVSKDQIQQLNKNYRGKDSSTNILSFEMSLPDYVEEPLIGDLAISPEVVEFEAKQQNKKLEDHWAHLVIHGTLHLLGYDHVIEEEAEIMESLEVKLLESIDIKNPYEN